MASLRRLLALALTASVACNPPPSTGADASPESSTPDSARDAPALDAPGDAPAVDSAPEASAPDSLADSPAETSVDVAADAPAEAALDAPSLDATADAPAESAVGDAAPEVSAVDAPAEAAAEASSCVSPAVLCGGSCVDTSTDLANCGACGAPCAAPTGGTAVCTGGSCARSCPSGSSNCGGTCLATGSACTSSGSGGCARMGAVVCASSGAATVCSAAPRTSGSCTAPTGGVCDATGTCACAGATPDACAGACTNRQTDVNNCGACGRSCGSGQSCMTGVCVGPPQLLSPLSTATATSQRPTLRWVLPPLATGGRVQVCQDRACTRMEQQFDVTGTSGAPPSALARGMHFWRVVAMQGALVTTFVSPTWEFFVGPRSAPVDRSWGNIADFNGDGYADLAVGSFTDTGRVFIYNGTSSGPSTTASTVLLGTGPLGILCGAGDIGSFGTVVASAGDLNGDGFADLAVGAHLETVNGRVFLYLGGPSGLSTTAATVLNGPGGAGGLFGNAIAGVGDVNGDGFADLAVGAAGEASNTGRAYVFLGGNAGLNLAARVALAAPGGANGTFGSSLAGVGDVNGDGFADLAVSAVSEVSNTGRAYVFLGGSAGPMGSAVTTLTGPGGAGGLFGTSLASGDLNGDGLPDLVVGAPAEAADTGAAYVFLGGASGLGSAAAAVLPGPAGTGGYFGFALSAAGDFNGDGFAELAVGAPHENGLMGNLYLFSGSASGLSTTSRNLSGPFTNNYFGNTVTSAGDVNGDGLGDLAVGAPRENVAVGSVYLYRGSVVGLGALPPTVFVEPGTMNCGQFGFSIASAAELLGGRRYAWVDAQPWSRCLPRAWSPSTRTPGRAGSPATS